MLSTGSLAERAAPRPSTEIMLTVSFQMNHPALSGDIAQAKDAFPAIQCCSLDSEDFLAEIQNLLVGIRVERGMTPPDAQGVRESPENLLYRAAAGQTAQKFALLPLGTVDRPWVSQFLDSFQIIACSNQTIEIDRRNAAKLH